MRKLTTSLLVIMFVLSMMGAAFAAEYVNPFSDVPAKHWAYDAVAKLAKAGLLDGYGDKTFKGDKTMTRYEMAQLVAKVVDKDAKASAENKALIKKLTAEFGDELKNLGVRVTALEKNNKGAKMSGELLYVMAGDSPAPAFKSQRLTAADAFWIRARIWWNIPLDPKTEMFVRLGTPRFKAGQSTTAANAAFDAFAIDMKDQMGVNRLQIGKIGSNGLGYGFFLGKAGGSEGIYLEKKVGPDLTFRSTLLLDTATVNTGNTTGTTAATNTVANIKDAKSNELMLGSLMYKTGKNSGVQAGYYYANEPGQQGTTYQTSTLNIDLPGTNGFKASKGWLVGTHQEIGKLFLLAEYVATTTMDATGAVPHNPKAWNIQIHNGALKNAKLFAQSNFVDKSKPHTDGWLIGYSVMEAGSIPYSQQAFNTWHLANDWAVPTGYTNQISPYRKGDNMTVFRVAYQNVLKKNLIMTLEYADSKLYKRSLVQAATTDDLDKTYKMMVEFSF